MASMGVLSVASNEIQFVLIAGDRAKRSQQIYQRYDLKEQFGSKI